MKKADFSGELESIAERWFHIQGELGGRQKVTVPILDVTVTGDTNHKKEEDSKGTT